MVFRRLWKRGRDRARSSERRQLGKAFQKDGPTTAKLSGWPFTLELVIFDAFLVVGPSLWNCLSLTLRLFPRVLSNSFYAQLKLFFLAVLESGALLSSHFEGAL